MRRFGALVFIPSMLFTACAEGDEPDRALAGDASLQPALDGSRAAEADTGLGCVGNGLVCRASCASDVSLPATCVAGEWTCAAPYVSNLRPADCEGKWGGACRAGGTCDADLACAAGYCLAACRSGAGAGACRAQAVGGTATTCTCARVDGVCTIPGDFNYVCPDGTIPASTCTSTVPGC